jgi:hypothetical protein
VKTHTALVELAYTITRVFVETEMKNNKQKMQYTEALDEPELLLHGQEKIYKIKCISHGKHGYID